MEYEIIELPDDEQVAVCVDCGAHAATAEEVEHYPSCTPGESKKWEHDYTECD